MQKWKRIADRRNRLQWLLQPGGERRWHFLLTSTDILRHRLTSTYILRHILTSTDILRHILTPTGIFRHLLTPFDVRLLLTSDTVKWHLLTSPDIYLQSRESLGIESPLHWGDSRGDNNSHNQNVAQLLQVQHHQASPASHTTDCVFAPALPPSVFLLLLPFAFCFLSGSPTTATGHCSCPCFSDCCLSYCSSCSCS